MCISDNLLARASALLSIKRAMLLSAVAVLLASCASSPPQAMRLYSGPVRSVDAVAHIKVARGAVILSMDGLRLPSPSTQPLDVLPGVHSLEIAFHDELLSQGSHTTAYEVKKESEVLHFMANAGKTYGVIVKFATPWGEVLPYDGLSYETRLDNSFWNAYIVAANSDSSSEGALPSK